MGRRANINNERNDDLRKTLRDNPNKRQGRRVNVKAIIIGNCSDCGCSYCYTIKPWKKSII